MSQRDHCPACACQVVEHAFIKDGYNILKCRTCGTLFVANVPDAEQLGLIYASNTYYELPRESVERIEFENLRRLKSIQKYLTNGNWLDIGCARGGMLDGAAQVGFTTYGVEPTHSNAEISLSKGHRVFNGDLEEFFKLNDGIHFDVITCLDVIEHVEFACDFLRLAASLLKKDGVMVLSTPNYSGLVAKQLGVNDPYMTPPEHLNFFTAAGLRLLAERCGVGEFQYTNFGSLTTAETERSINRYLPWLWRPLYPVVNIVVNICFRIANRFRVGLEQEIYLKKTR